MKNLTILATYFLILAVISLLLIGGTYPAVQRAIELGMWYAVPPMVGVMIVAAVLPFMWTGLLWYKMFVIEDGEK